MCVCLFLLMTFLKIARKIFEEDLDLCKHEPGPVTLSTEQQHYVYQSHSVIIISWDPRDCINSPSVNVFKCTRAASLPWITSESFYAFILDS